MKIALKFLIIIVLLTQCKRPEKAEILNNAETTEATKENEEITKAEVIIKTEKPKLYPEVYGNWVGSFQAKEFKKGSDFVYENKINLRIDHISENKTVTGRSVVAGNDRGFEGKINANENGYSMTLNEPGDHKYDGVFEVHLNSEKDSITGTWIAYNQSIAVTKRSFVLEKKDFSYNKDLMLLSEEEIYEDMEGSGYVDWYNSKNKVAHIDEETGEVYTMDYYRSASEAIYKLNASNTKLKADDLKNLRKLDLEIIRNTIFARHGYTFNKKSVRQFFDWIDWYVPISDNVGNQLTSLEKENIKLLQRFEKYSEDNYDSFGR